MNRRYLLPATAVLTVLLAVILVPFMKDAVDTGLAGSARAALASKDVAGVTVNSDWARLTLRGSAPARTPALAAVRAMAHGDAVSAVRYVCVGAAPCSPAASASPATASPSAISSSPSQPPSASPSTSPSPAPSVSPPSASVSAGPPSAGTPGTGTPGREATIRAALGKEGLTFAAGAAELTPRAKRVLRHMAVMLSQAPGLKVSIAGFTDSSGSASLNQALSLARANATRDYLEAHGVAAGRMNAAGYGEERPIATNATAAGRAANRRIDFTVQGS